MMFEQYDDILTIEELCEILMIGRNAAYSLLKDQRIPAFRIRKTWKIPKKAVEAHILKQIGVKS